MDRPTSHTTVRTDRYTADRSQGVAVDKRPIKSLEAPPMAAANMIDKVYGHVTQSRKTSVEDQMQEYFSEITVKEIENPLLCKGFSYGVSSGSRTHDLQGHNLAL